MRERAGGLLPGAEALTGALEAHAVTLGLTEASPRLASARVLSGLLNQLAGTSDATLLLRALAGAELPRDDAIYRAHLDSARGVAAAMNSTRWPVLDRLPEIAAADGGAPGAALLGELRSAAGHDEHEAALADALRRAEQEATALVIRAASKPEGRPAEPPANPAGSAEKRSHREPAARVHHPARQQRQGSGDRRGNLHRGRRAAGRRVRDHLAGRVRDMTAATVTTGAIPTANKAMVAAELRRAIERRARRRDERGQNGATSRVLLLQAAPEWLDNPELRVTGFEDDRAEAATVAACPTVLAVLDALASHHGTERYLVILTPCDDEELGGSVLAQAIGNHVHTINRWDLVIDAFGARRRGPGVSGKEKPWLAGALLDAQPPDGWGKVSGPVLTLDLVMSRLVGVRFGISDGRDEATMDAAALLEWTRNELRVLEFQQLRREERDGLADWLRDSVGPVARAVFGMLESAEAADAIPVGLALRGLTEPDARHRRALATAWCAPRSGSSAGTRRLRRTCGRSPRPPSR